MKMKNKRQATTNQTTTTMQNEPNTAPNVAFAEPLSSIALLAKEDATSNLQLATINPEPSGINHPVIDAKPLTRADDDAMSPVPSAPRKSRRKGRVASLPKIQRDMVNHMLWNGVPYKNVVAALDDAGFSLTERNISNWATGGYLEWRLEQEAVLENRLNQDHLLDFLRRDDAPELPEVDLQAAANRISHA